MNAILVVDDEASIREMLEIMLTKEGYRVATAPSGPEALQLFKKQSFAVVLTDIRMRPMDGLALLKEIKGLQPRTEVIMISAFADTETAVEAMNEGAYDYFPKPFDLTELKSVIRSALSKYQGQPSQPVEKVIPFHFQTKPLVGQSPHMKRVYRINPEGFASRQQRTDCRGERHGQRTGSPSDPREQPPAQFPLRDRLLRRHPGDLD